MPIYEYQVKMSHKHKGCEVCRNVFARMQRISDPPLTHCPACGAPVRKCLSVPAIGASQSNLDQRAKSAGFHKLKKVSKGEYEKQY